MESARKSPDDSGMAPPLFTQEDRVPLIAFPNVVAATRDHVIRYNAAQERMLERSSPSARQERLA